MPVLDAVWARDRSRIRLSRIVWAVMPLAAAGLVAASAYRATTSSFTHDESLSFAIFHWAPSWGSTANNQLLNTWLMRLCSSVFGDSEISLRVPSVAAHSVYLVAVLLLLKRLRNSLLQAAGFVLLGINPFLLDFFTVARGYGLALAFLMLSLYLLVRTHEESVGPRCERYAFLAGLTAALAVLANWSFMTYYVPMVLVTACVLLGIPPFRRISRERLAPTAVFLGAGAAFGIFALHRLMFLRTHGELYFGGHHGFFEDTIEGLVRASAYSTTLSRWVAILVSAGLIAVIVPLLLLSVRRFVQDAEVSVSLLFTVILAGATGLPIVERYVFHVLWPIERAAAYYIPLYTVALVFGVDSLIRQGERRWQASALVTPPTVLAVVLASAAITHFHVHSTLDWSYDAHDKNAIEIVERDHATRSRSSSVRLGDTWLMEPSLNFYRVTRHETWLAPVTRRPVTEGHYDYVYGLESDVDQLRDRTITLATYADTKTALVRIVR
jgi:dolichyl-phosphate-mannose-protein mannosyltransferase